MRIMIKEIFLFSFLHNDDWLNICTGWIKVQMGIGIIDQSDETRGFVQILISAALTEKRRWIALFSKVGAMVW